MLTPRELSLSSIDSTGPSEMTNPCLKLEFQGKTMTVHRDGFTIGSSGQCDLILADPSIPRFHSLIHLQGGAVWIEAANDDSQIVVNGRNYRRLALRHDDRLSIGSTDFTVRMTNDMPSVLARAAQMEDLSLLTAEELCDRIIAEQSMIDEFIGGRRSGWDSLLRAIQSANEESQMGEPVLSHSAGEIPKDNLDLLLEQIQEISESLEERTRELSEHEKEVLQSTSIAEESQMRAVQKLDQIIDKLNEPDISGELRASA